MMKLQRCILIMLNLLFVTGHEEFTHSTQKVLENEDTKLHNLKDIIDKRFKEDIIDRENNEKNQFKAVPDGIITLLRELKRNVEVQRISKNKKTNDGKMILDDDILALIYNIESARSFRRFISPILNFIKDFWSDGPNEKRYIYRYQNQGVNVNFTEKPKSNHNIIPNNLWKTGNGYKVVKVTGNKIVDINDDANVKTWDQLDNKFWETSGQYNIVNENGEVTGYIKITNYVNGKKIRRSHYEPEYYTRSNIGNQNWKRISRISIGGLRNGYKVVKVTGNKTLDVNDDANTKNWDQLDNKFWQTSGQYKIVNEKGEVTGNININNNVNGKKWSHYEPEHYTRPNIGNQNWKGSPHCCSDTTSSKGNKYKIQNENRPVGGNASGMKKHKHIPKNQGQSGYWNSAAASCNLDNEHKILKDNRSVGGNATGSIKKKGKLRPKSHRQSRGNATASIKKKGKLRPKSQGQSRGNATGSIKKKGKLRPKSQEQSSKLVLTI